MSRILLEAHAHTSDVSRCSRLPAARLVEVPEVGHAPTMDEAEARAAIDGWIAKLPAA